MSLILGNNIKKYLDSNGIKYSHIADAVGIPNNIFSTMLNEKRKIVTEEYFTICEALKLDANYFANGNPST